MADSTSPTPVSGSDINDYWPALPFDAWKDTYETLHMWTQIVGKIRAVQTPFVNHSWHVPLYLTSRGLTTSPVPYGMRIFQIDFDFIDHRLMITTGDGHVKTMALEARPVADFYHELLSMMRQLGFAPTIHTTPNEVGEAIPFDKDQVHASYDADYANRFWRTLVQADRVFKQFRARFIGKCSPVHFFWGSFDLALTRFSGRTAPLHPGGIPHLPDWLAREAYSHELSSCGFWPGGEAHPDPVFYAYAYPEPEGFNTATVHPDSAVYDASLREFLLPYEQVRNAPSPDAMLLEFLQSTYAAAANLANWNRSAVERESEWERVLQSSA